MNEVSMIEAFEEKSGGYWKRLLQSQNKVIYGANYFWMSKWHVLRNEKQN